MKWTKADHDRNHRLVRRAQNGDKDALEELVRLLAPLVYWTRHKYFGDHPPDVNDEMVQAGLMSIERAVKSYSVDDKRANFATFVVYVVRYAMLGALGKEHHGMWPGQERNRNRKKIERLAARLGYQPNAQEAAQLLDMPLKSIENALAVKPWQSIYATNADGGLGDSIIEALPSPDLDPEELFLADEQQSEMSAAIEEHLAELTELNRTIVEMRYGLNGYEPMKNREIAEKLNMTMAAIAGRYQTAIDQLRQHGVFKQWAADPYHHEQADGPHASVPRKPSKPQTQRSKLTSEDIDRIREKHSKGMSLLNLSKEYHLSLRTIRRNAFPDGVISTCQRTGCDNTFRPRSSEQYCSAECKRINRNNHRKLNPPKPKPAKDKDQKRSAAMPTTPQMKLLIKDAQAGDKSAMDKVIEENAGLVSDFFIRRGGSRSYGSLRDDVTQAAFEGLMRAAELYDPDKGEFSTYAGVWMASKVQRLVHAQGHLFALPTGNSTAPAHLVDKIRQAREQLSQENGVEPSNAEIAEAVGIPESEVELLIGTISGWSQVNETNYPAVSEDAGYGLVMDDDQIQSYMRDLDERERDIIAMRYGLDGGPECSFATIGKKYDITKARAHQIHAESLQKMQLAANA